MEIKLVECAAHATALQRAALCSAALAAACLAALGWLSLLLGASGQRPFQPAQAR